MRNKAIGGCNVTLSCNNREVENYPAGIIINYFYRLMTSRVYRIKGGVKNIVPKLVANLTLKTESPIAAVQRNEKKISLKVKEEIVDFDHVIFATSPASTLDILGNSATIEEKSIFESFSYANTKIYLHTDKKVQKDFPSMLNIIISEKFDYAPFNLYINPALTDEFGMPLPFSDTYYFQTFNPIGTIDEKLIITEANFSRVVITPKTKGFLERLNRIQGKGNTWYCGAYSLYSMNLLEDGVKSAIGIAKKFGIFEPWITPEELSRETSP